jgi:hypothetical protein
MSESDRRRNLVSLAAVIAVPLVVAVVLAGVVLSSRNDPVPEGSGALPDGAATTASVPVVEGVTVPAGDYQAFCRTTRPLHDGLVSFLPKKGETLRPSEVATALASVDVSDIDGTDLPAEVRDAVKAVADQQDAVVANIRALPADARPEEVTLPSGWLKALNLVGAAYNQKCEGPATTTTRGS